MRSHSISPSLPALHAGKRFYDFDRIRQEILAETERLAGGNKGVCDKPIRLKIYSSSVLCVVETERERGGRKVACSWN